MAAAVSSSSSLHPRLTFSSLPPTSNRSHRRQRPISIRCVGATSTESERVATVSSGGDSLVICRVLNGMWQTGGGWGRIDRDSAVDAMFRYADSGLSTFDMADHYGPAEDLYGIFINKVRRERPPELLEEIKGSFSIYCASNLSKISSSELDSKNISE